MEIFVCSLSIVKGWSEEVCESEWEAKQRRGGKRERERGRGSKETETEDEGERDTHHGTC